jgi:hypothetical protein
MAIATCFPKRSNVVAPLRVSSVAMTYFALALQLSVDLVNVEIAEPVLHDRPNAAGCQAPAIWLAIEATHPLSERGTTQRSEREREREGEGQGQQQGEREREGEGEGERHGEGEGERQGEGEGDRDRRTRR